MVTTFSSFSESALVVQEYARTDDMALLILRTFLSDAHARGLVATGLLDREVTDRLLEERLVRIRAQITCALVLRAMLAELGFRDVPGTIDLRPIVAVAERHGILNRRHVAILLQINTEANESKHLLDFVSRL